MKAFYKIIAFFFVFWYKDRPVFFLNDSLCLCYSTRTLIDVTLSLLIQRYRTLPCPDQKNCLCLLMTS